MSGKKKKNAEAASCDWKTPYSVGIDRGPSRPTVPDNKGRIFRHSGDFGWSGVRTEKYKTYDSKGWNAITRKVLVGNRGETAKFHLRYFELSPGGYSSLEKHRHEHVVVCIRGKGALRLDDKTFKIGYLDTVYIAPDTAHQLSNPYKEQFGFFCIVNARRDKPKTIKKEVKKIRG